MIQGRWFAERVGWGVADQALSSVTNFTLGIAMARTASPAEFGVYGLLFAAYLIAINITRPIAIEPLLIRFSGRDDGRWHDALADASGTVAMVGLGLGLVAIAIGVTQSGFLGSGFVVLGLLIPGLVLQDGWRFAFFGARRGPAAFLNDLVWAGTLVPIIVFLEVQGSPSPLALVAAWGITANIAAGVGILQTRVRPHPLATLAWWRANRDLGRPLLGDRIATNIVGEVTPYAIGAIAGLPAVGALRAAQLLLGPFTVMFQGLGLVALPEAVRIVDRPDRTLLRAATLYSVGLMALVMTTGIILFLVPSEIGQVFLGENWLAARDTLLPYTLFFAALMAVAGPSVGLRALGEARASFRVGVVRSALGSSGAIVGAATGGAPMAALGMALGHAVGAVETWREFGRAVRRRRRPGEAAGLPPGSLPETDRR